MKNQKTFADLVLEALGDREGIEDPEYTKTEDGYTYYVAGCDEGFLISNNNMQMFSSIAFIDESPGNDITSEEMEQTRTRLVQTAVDGITDAVNARTQNPNSK